MLVSTEQLIELLAEASGLSSDNIERQLSELTNDSEQAISEGEAYEIEGFGIFSGIGNRIMFIPSKDLETEINYKYVGMEPIELDEPEPLKIEDDDPFSGLIDQEEEKASTTAFTGLVEGLDELEEEAPGADKWGVDAHKEDDSAGRLFASLMGQKYEEPENELKEDDVFSAEEESFDQYGDDIFGGDSSDSDSNEELENELSELMGREPKINAYDDSSSFLDDLMDDVSEGEEPLAEEEKEELEDTVENIISEEELLALDTVHVDDDEPFDFDEEPLENELNLDDVDAEPANELDEKLDEIELPDFEEAGEDEEDDFDDPFSNLDAPEVNEELIIDSVDDEDIIPVIKNLSSEGVSKTESKKEEIKEKAPEEKKKKKEKKEKPKDTEKKPAPAWLWIVLLLVVAGSAVGALGYLNIIRIPYISPQVAVNNPTVIPTPVQPTPTPSQTVQESPPQNTTENEEVNNTQPEETTPVVQEQPEEVEVTETGNVELPTGTNPEKYGLKGELSANGNDGYTIILYSLSNQANANREVQRLATEGYRAMLIPAPSQQYGTLYRVSIGQFGTLFDAAVAAEGIMDILPENYLIKKIN